MTLWCICFALSCFLVVIFTDDTHEHCRPTLAFWGGITAVVGALVISGCASLGREHTRPTEDARDIAQEALCSPLPVCDIPPEANAKQLQSALWGCILEYRALFSACAHAVKPIPKLPPTAYHMQVCRLTDPVRCE